jgi:hypothetical protein
VNWKTSLFKPKWQHKNPDVRSRAVAEEQDPALLEVLGRIVTTDDAAGVRAAAARRVDDPGVIVSAIATESDADVREVLNARLRSLLSNPRTEGEKLEVRIKALKQSNDRALCEAVALSAPEPQLRRAALEMIERPGFLGDRAIEDSDPELRRYAASRINQASTLKRVIEATRTRDKSLHQSLIERLHREQLAAGDQEAIDREALTICEQLEVQAIRGSAHDDEAVAQLESRWNGLNGAMAPSLQQRFTTDLRRLRQPTSPLTPPVAESALEPVTEPPPEVVPDKPVVDPEPESASETAASAPPVDTTQLQSMIEQMSKLLERDEPPKARAIDRLADQWQAAFAANEQPAEPQKALDLLARQSLQQLRERLSQAEAAREQALARAREQLALMQQALDDGELHKALELRAQLQAAGKSLTAAREWKSIQSQMSLTLGRLRELRDWQHWANDKIRKRLITEMEALPGSGLHPDAVLDRIKSLQSEWKSLEQSEQIPGDRHYAAAPWMWRKFNAAGRQAFELTKPYLDKRSEVQSREREQLEATANELLQQAKAEEVDWKALNRSMTKARKALRSLSSLPHRDRKKTAALLKEALEAGSSLKQQVYDEIEKQKLKLIREAAQLQHLDDRDEALSRAKSLQSQWKAAGSLWRSRENELWAQFREPIDPLFSALDEERDQARAEQAERLTQQQSLCEQLEALLANEDEDLLEQAGRVQGLTDQWGDFRQVDRRLKDRFERRLEEFRHRQSAQRRQEAARERDLWWARADALHDLESATRAGKLTAAKRKKLQQVWPEGDAGDAEIDRALEQRFQAALDAEVNKIDIPEADTEAAREICIGLEFLAGLPGPEEEKELRMQYQVQRLSASMTGARERIPAMEEARQLERAWLMLGFLPDETHTAFRERVRRALSNILEE